MSARQVRVETRSRHQNDLKRVMHSTEKVRKWEKKWVRIEETSLQIFKWMPITKNEEQQRQQLQEQLSAPKATETTNTGASKLYNDELKRNQENIQLRGTPGDKEAKLNVSITLDSNPKTMHPIGTLTNPTTTGSVISNKNTNRSDDVSKMSDLSTVNNGNNGAICTTTTLTQHSNNNNKRPHEGNHEAESNESINSPYAKRVKTTVDILITTGITGLVDGNSTLASMHSADPVSSPVPSSPRPPSRVQQPAHLDFKETTSHLQQMQAESPLIAQQQQLQHQLHHVQPTTTTTTTTMPNPNAYTQGNDIFKLTTTNGDGDIEMMMETEEMITGDSCGVKHQQQPLSAVSNVTDAIMEDFSSIVRNVTEQIVLKVSDCYGGDN